MMEGEARSEGSFELLVERLQQESEAEAYRWDAFVRRLQQLPAAGTGAEALLHMLLTDETLASADQAAAAAAIATAVHGRTDAWSTFLASMQRPGGGGGSMPAREAEGGVEVDVEVDGLEPSWEPTVEEVAADGALASSTASSSDDGVDDGDGDGEVPRPRRPPRPPHAMNQMSKVRREAAQRDPSEPSSPTARRAPQSRAQCVAPKALAVPLLVLASAVLYMHVK